MRISVIAAVLALSACGPSEAHLYPAETRAEFDSRCQMGASACACVWETLTRAMTHEEYQDAMARFAAEGLMDPRVTRARTECLAEGAG